ncbi:tetratricopeptide repeat protein [Clostridium saccharoperbutylacetonicum]|uniref:tetratricopeptide repeat protein n=1 Tax=Clostridium saccharoperbutylacetonicum TaxID=36745 RepID=UPI0039EC3BED
MDKRAKKAYEKAMNYYEKGKINKALELCEEALSEGLDNPLVLNFKGLLLYQKGNLNEAVTVWRINHKINNDAIAENYIRDSEMDEMRQNLYNEAEQALNQLKITKALELFMKCAESDFNSIDVNTKIALCYQKKGDFYRAKEYIDKALIIDGDAILAKSIEEELKQEGNYLNYKKSSKTFLAVIIGLVLALIIGICGYSIIKFKNSNLENNISADNIGESQNNEQKSKEDANNSKLVEPNDKAEGEAKEQTGSTNLDKEKLKLMIGNNDFDGIYVQLKNIKQEEIKPEDNEIYKKAISLMKDAGISKFYETGLKYFNQNNYLEAKDELDKAYTYCEGSSIKEHIWFYRASSYDKLSDANEAVAQFEKYYDKYPRGVYTQEVLYELALLTNKSDKEKSKKYANMLINNFPNSIYVNDNIAAIARN